jgi:3'(2'), 5'-bisphosphate nucleotidase
MDSRYARELSAAIDAVRLAARVCQSVQAQITPDVLEKKDKSPVTVADFASQAVVCRALAAAFPDDPVVGEEDAAELRAPDQALFRERVRKELAVVGIDADDDAICRWIDRGGHGSYCGRFWTLDPIDGTKGFLRSEQYAISLALIVDGKIDVAVLGCPNLPSHDAWDRAKGCVFTAVRGAGAWLRPLAGDREAPQRVSVSPTGDSKFARFCESVESGHSSHDHSAQVAQLLGITSQPARLDSQAKYGVVARGEADIYLRLPTKKDYHEKIWDHAGGVLVVEEAGGTVTDVAGRPLDFTMGRELRNNRGVIVTNGKLHEPVLAALRSVGVT